MSSLWNDASAIGGYVNGRVLSLQRRYLGNGAQNASARATLAQLRSLGTPGQSAWAIVGGELFENMPELGLSARDERRMLRAIVGTMSLYARHQQGNEMGVALSRADGDGAKRPRSFGWSCRMIEPDLDESEGVRRRMQGIEAASDFSGVMYYARGLVDLMKRKPVPVDYGLFARDLYLVQFYGASDRVFLTWSRDYYTAESSDGAPTSSDDSGSISPEKE